MAEVGLAQTLAVADRFLTEVLDIPVFRLDGPASRLADAGVEGLSESLVWAKVPSNDISRVNQLQHVGFRLIVTEVQFEHAFADAPPTSLAQASAVSVHIRPAEPADEVAVGAIAAEAFTEDRFHRDTAIDATAASRVKEMWARNFFKGLRGDRMFVAENMDGSVVGFAQLLDVDGATIIDLIAVATRAQGMGVGRLLTAATIASASIASRAVRVGTQLTNTPSLRLYAREGFTIAESSYVLHRHPDLDGEKR